MIFDGFVGFIPDPGKKYLIFVNVQKYLILLNK